MHSLFQMPDLRNCVIESIEANWENLTCEISIRAGNLRYLIRIRNPTLIDLPKFVSWGRFSQILSAKRTLDGLEIQMRSGDKLVFHGMFEMELI